VKSALHFTIFPPGDEEERVRTRFLWRGVEICSSAFCSITTLNKTTVQALVRSVRKERAPTILAESHGNKGQKRGSTRATTIAANFILEYAQLHGSASPFPVSKKDNRRRIILPVRETKTHIHKEYMAMFRSPTPPPAPPPPPPRPPLPVAAPPEKPKNRRGRRKKHAAPEDLSSFDHEDLPVQRRAFNAIWQQHCPHVVISPPQEF
jgi:hypothetical protein